MLSPAEIRALEQHIPALRRYARALVRDEDHADDLVQDCLERAIGRFSQFQTGTNLRTWLFTILHNLHMDLLRRQGRQGVHVPIEQWASTASVPANQGRLMMLRDFARALDGLPAGDRDVLILIGLEGFSYEEAGDILGVAVGTVKSRLFRARERLRSLEREMGNPVPAFLGNGATGGDEEGWRS